MCIRDRNSVDFFRSLDIPVRTLECCSGDLADLKVKSCDVEAWSPRQKKYFEVGSCSNLGDAQALSLIHIFLYEGGLKEYIAFLNKNKTPIHEEIIYVEGEQDGIQVEIAMQYNDGYVPNVYSFCNNINTGEGGTHEEGFKLALNRKMCIRDSFQIAVLIISDAELYKFRLMINPGNNIIKAFASQNLHGLHKTIFHMA